MKDFILYILGGLGAIILLCILLAGKYADRGY